MDGRQLLKALMTAAGENPNSLADALGARTLQSQIARFIDGRTRNPRWSTLEPVARHYGVKVEAFLDDEAAEVVAAARGLLGPNAAASLDTAAASAPTPIRTATKPLSVHELVLQLGKALSGYDLPARKAVGSLLADMTSNPEDAARTADRIERLLGEPGNDQPRRSSNSSGG
jgi:transcriptional regulator with XRE-family HTH domain